MGLSQFLTHEERSPKGMNSLNYLFYLEDVGVAFKDFWALKSVHLTISGGEKLFLTGPSGAGKTTLLRVLAREITPTTGKIVGPKGEGHFVSTVYQELRLLESASAEDNLWVAYDGQFYKSKQDFFNEMKFLAQFLGIADRLHIKLSCANGGMKQKLAIIRSLLTRPTILLADEPTSALDRENSFRLYELLDEYTTRRGMTLVWASHNKELVRQFNGRTIHLEKGKLIYVGHACFI